MFGLTARNNNRGLRAYNPFREMEEIEKAFFANPFSNFWGNMGLDEFKTDVIDEGDYYLLEADLPGFEKKDISDLSLEWSKSIDLISNREYYIPTNAIYHPYISKDDSQSLFKSNTNGLASGNILEEAILHGIFEVIERDAWSIFELTHNFIFFFWLHFAV